MGGEGYTRDHTKTRMGLRKEKRKPINGPEIKKESNTLANPNPRELYGNWEYVKKTDQVSTNWNLDREGLRDSTKRGTSI